jgi:DNA-binding transcriptional MerR regulator
VTRKVVVELLTIGEFARLSRLSPKALRLYDELGLLAPARVDADNGYRRYAVAQLERAHLIALLRRIDLPLAEIKTILALEPAAAARRIATYWEDVETEHDARRDLAGYIVDLLSGREHVMFEVATRTLPERWLLCQLRHVADEQQTIAFGKEFLAIFKERPQPLVAGAPFLVLIYHGEVSADSDGPVEFCRPVSAEQAEKIAALYPELTLRSEPAHEEAFVHVGQMQLSGAQWQLVSESLRSWSSAERRMPSDLGVRLTYLAAPPITPDSRPEIDFAVPLS